MSTLTGSQINQSYQGLIKLADSTTGITSTFQSVQDGLGNDTGLKISTKGLAGANTLNFYKPSLGQYYGNGFGTVAANPSSNGNVILSNWFYDSGVASYSAFTVNCTTLHASETVELAFYNSQYLDGYGYVPYQKVMSEVTITGTTSTGIKTMVLGSPITFSGNGPGFYFAVCRYNGAASPTIRLASGVLALTSFTVEFLRMQSGFVYNTAGTAAFSPTQNVGTSIAATWVYNTASFPTTWTSTELNTLTASSSASMIPGFLLHTVR